MQTRFENREEFVEFLNNCTCYGQSIRDDSENLLDVLAFVEDALEGWDNMRAETQIRFADAISKVGKQLTRIAESSEKINQEMSAV